MNRFSSIAQPRILALALVVLAHGLILTLRTPVTAPAAAAPTREMLFRLFSAAAPVKRVEPKPPPTPLPTRPAALPPPAAAAIFAPAAEPESMPAPPAPVAPSTTTPAMIDLAKRAIPRIVREEAARKRPGQSDTPTFRSKIEERLAEAAAPTCCGLTMDSYVSPDGVAITRVNSVRGAKCYMSGTTNFRPGVLADSARAQQVSCPHDVPWQRH